MEALTDDERIRQHADLVYRTCLRITGNAQDAADVAQEVFVTWLRSHREIRGSVAAWLYGTARQRSLDWLRAKHRRVRHEQQAEGPVATELSEEDWRLHLDDALNELPTPVRGLVVEHHLMGLTQGQLAARHRCTQATISRRLTQALDLLRVALRSRGVTASGAVLIAGFTAAPVSACPAPLIAPILAQAQVTGATALVGPSVIGGLGLLGWSTMAASVLLVLALLGGAGLWWWGAQVAHELNRDWTVVATAHLPEVDPVEAAKIRLPQHSLRYPSIEALIARQAVRAKERQERLERLITPDCTTPWSWLDAPTLESLTASLSKVRKGVALDPGELRQIQQTRERLRPLLSHLRSETELALGAGPTLAEAYANDRLTSNDQRIACLRSRFGGETHSIARVIVHLLDQAAREGTDVGEALADLDAWVAANTRGVVTLYEAMVTFALLDLRDRCYQDLAWQGRLIDEMAQRWLAETCPAASVLSDGFMGETLLLLIPEVEDLRDGRTASDPLTHVGDLFLAQEYTWLPRNLATIQQVLAGQDAGQFRALIQGETAHGQKRFWPGMAHQTELVAVAESRHRASRLAVQLLMRVRAGEPLPDTLETASGRGVNAWDLRYERLSTTRFALVIDPDGGLPACATPEVATALREQVKEARTKPRTQPVVNQHLFIEMETPPLSGAAPPAVPIRLPPVDDDPLPPFQTLAQ